MFGLDAYIVKKIHSYYKLIYITYVFPLNAIHACVSQKFTILSNVSKLSMSHLHSTAKFHFTVYLSQVSQKCVTHFV
jgi:hypothetical protein